MTFYEKKNVTENYLSMVRDLLIARYSISRTDASNAVAESGLAEAIESCPYIAMHYPVAKAADIIAKKAPEATPIFVYNAHAVV